MITKEGLMLDYVKAIKHAETLDVLEEIDNKITFDNDVSIRGYAILMNVIDMRKEMLK